MKYSIQAAKDAAKKASEETSLDIRKGACLLSAEVTGACGERTLAESKSMLEGEVLDSKMLSGTKLRWFPKEPLRFVGKHSAAVRRIFAQNGVSFGKGLTLVPLASLPYVSEELDQAESEFKADLEQLKSDYANLIAQHQAKNPDIARHIEKCIEPIDRFLGRFSFEVHPPMAIQPLFDGDEADMALSAAQQLMSEIASEADKIYRNSFCGKETATKKKLNPVFALRDKLMNLSFLDASVSRVALKFDEVLTKLPKVYPLEGGDFHTVCHFLTLVSDEGKLKSYGQGGDDLDDTRNQNQSLDLDDDADVVEIEAETVTEDATDEQEQIAPAEDVAADADVSEEPLAQTTPVIEEAIDDLSGLTLDQPLVDTSGSQDDWDFSEWD
jgi:hypothetical protein